MQCRLSRKRTMLVPFKWHPDEIPPIIEEHSKAKLLVLRKYLHAYFDKLNVVPNREEFKLDLVDGFAGGGTFRDGDEIVSGTPLVMLEEIESAEERLNEKRKKSLRFDCKCYFVDVEAAHTDHLRKSLIERGHLVEGKNIVIRNSRFEDASMMSLPVSSAGNLAWVVPSSYWIKQDTRKSILHSSLRVFLSCQRQR